AGCSRRPASGLRAAAGNAGRARRRLRGRRRVVPGRVRPPGPTGLGDGPGEPPAARRGRDRRAFRRLPARGRRAAAVPDLVRLEWRAARGGARGRRLPERPPPRGRLVPGTGARSRLSAPLTPPTLV